MCDVANSKEKNSQSLTGKLVSKNNPNFGHYWSNEKKARLSATLKIKARRWSEEERRAMSEKRKGMLIGEKNPMYGKIPPNIKKVNKYDLNGNYIQTYNSIKEAQNQNPKCSNISKVCRGERKQAGGFIWKYA